jgi:hypothetical protein
MEFLERGILMSKKIDIEGSEFKYLPTKKIELITRRENGDFVISKFENLVQVEAKKMGKKNPDKTLLFELRNKFGEKVQVCHYKGNDYLNLFVSGGVHDSRFIMSKELLSRLLNSLTEYTSILNKTTDIHVQNSKECEKNG